MKSKQNDLILRTKDFHSMISERKAFEMSYIRWNTVKTSTRRSQKMEVRH